MSSESTSPTASPSTGTSGSPPPPPSSTSPPPPSTTSPPPPANTPPPSTPPPANPTTPPPPPVTPPPAPPTSSPPPPSSSTPPPATPDASPSPPPPVPSAATPPASPPPVTPSSPVPGDATPAQNPPATPVHSPPKEKPISGETPRTPSLSPNPPSSSGGSGSSGSSESSSSSGDQPSLDGGVIAGIVVGGVVIIALLMVIICLMCNKRKRKPQYYMDPGRQTDGTNQYYNQDQGQWHSSTNPGGNGGGWGSTHMPAHPNMSGELSSHPMPSSANMGGITQFSYDELASATGGFCEANLLGQGGFGFVHKGIMPDRREVAVKSLKSGSGQGEREFQAEVEIISRVHHRHLVSLVGYCIAPHSKLLVYEYVANKTMEFHLHGEDRPVLDWPTRLRIAIGSAKGLAYLHEDCLPRIIHRDIKAANILIDNNFEAMVADFGLAKLTTDNNTHVSTRVMGTFGYLAPEYASSGKLSEKSDVFSFGVMLLELVTGRRPIDLTNVTMEDSLVDWARPLLAKALEDGNYDQLVDPLLQGNYAHHELARMAACAAASIRHSARKRPKMSQIVRALEGDSSLEDLNEGVKPGQSGAYNPSGASDIYDTRAYNADLMKFKQMILSSEEMESSEYGPNPSVSSNAHSMDMVDKKGSDLHES